MQLRHEEGTGAHVSDRAMGGGFLRGGRGPLFASVVLLSALAAGCGSSSAPAGQQGMPLPTVEVTPVAKESVELHTEWVATVDGSVNAQIQPQVTGYLVRQTYREGSFVRKGQTLFEIDPRPLRAALDQARAVQAQSESEVAQAESAVLQRRSELTQIAAQLRKAEIDVKRDEPLVAARAVSQSQLDTELQALAAAQAAHQAGRAKVATSRAAVKTAQAAVKAAAANAEQAELNLGFTNVESLIDGVAGVARTQVGNLVKTDTVLTTVSSVNPIRVYFPISEREYLELTGLSGAEKGLNLLQGGKGSLELILTNGTVYRIAAVIFADREVTRIPDHPDCRRVPQPRQHPAAGAVRPHPDGIGGSPRRIADPAARRHGSPGQAAGGRRRGGPEGADPHGDAGAGNRNALHR